MKNVIVPLTLLFRRKWPEGFVGDSSCFLQFKDLCTIKSSYAHVSASEVFCCSVKSARQSFIWTRDGHVKETEKIRMETEMCFIWLASYFQIKPYSTCVLVTICSYSNSITLRCHFSDLCCLTLSVWKIGLRLLAQKHISKHLLAFWNVTSSDIPSKILYIWDIHPD